MNKEIAVMAFAALASMAYADITSVSLNGTGAVNVNLTTEGTTDWVMLGQGGGTSGITNRDEKAGVNHIGVVTVTGTHDSWASHPSRFIWTDGSPTATAPDALGDWEAKPLSGLATTNQALTFSVGNLAVGDYSMMVYASSYKAAQLLTASIGASSLTAENAYVDGSAYTSYAIDFGIATAGDSLDIALNRNDSAGNQYSNVGISAVTIAAIPEPASLGLIGIFGGGLLFARRFFRI